MDQAQAQAWLGAYLQRIGLGHVPPPTPEGLAQVQRAHRLAIAFENLDILLGRGIPLPLDQVAAKLLGQRRGGYCFEQNGLFGAMLGAMGLANRPLLARVWVQAGDSMPARTHTLRLVAAGGQVWVADAGFGMGYVPPLPLLDGASAVADGFVHRLRRAGKPGRQAGEWLLERAEAQVPRGQRREWQPQYGFDVAEVAPIDLEMANHWTSTRPATRFTMGPVVSIVVDGGFAALTGRRLTMRHHGRGDVMEVADPEDWRAVLADLFHIALSAADVARLWALCGA